MDKFSSKDAVAQSLGYKRKTLNELKKEFDLPSNAEYCGYLVHIADKDEFLANYEDKPDYISRVFCKTPDHAMRFDEITDAIQLARSDKGESIVMLFDVGSQYRIYGI